MSDQSVTLGSQWDDIRTIKFDGELWFVLKDLCVKLGIEDVDQVVRRLDKDGVRLADVTDSLGRTRNVRVINKPNLISFLARSNKPEAFSLLDWMYQQVIAASQSPDTAGLLQENANLRTQTEIYLKISNESVRVPEWPYGSPNMVETGEIEAIVYSVRKLLKEVQAALKAKKLEPDVLLDLLRKIDKRMASLEERTSQTDEAIVRMACQFGKQEGQLKTFYAQALAMLPPARQNMKQITGPEQGE